MEQYILEYKYKNEIILINCNINKDKFNNWYNYTADFTNSNTNYKSVFEGCLYATNINKAKQKLYTIIDNYFDN